MRYPAVRPVRRLELDPQLDPATYQVRAARVVADLRLTASLSTGGGLPGAPAELPGLAVLSERMLAVEQAPGLSVLAHGLQVADAYLIVRAIAGGGPMPAGWRVPGWVRGRGLLERQLPVGDVYPAAVWHDCGKPEARILDAAGGVHFPGHAAISARLARELWPERPAMADLLEGDMIAHTPLDEDAAAAFAGREDAPTLLFLAVAEVHANAAMFGGLAADSFKMEAKRVDRRGRDYLRRTGA